MVNLDKDALYPLLFEPACKQVIWGGHRLAEKYGRALPEDGAPVGESWEICDRPEFASPVSNGPLKGVTLRELVEKFGREFVGRSFRGGRFPILVKLLDAEKRVSLQVHPDAAACAMIGGSAEPKSEMWYILDAAPGATILAGINPKSSKMRFLENLNSPDIEAQLQVFDSFPGDAYFIPAGRVHAIGAGNLLLEIQQNSDTTYRISDWGRVGADGKPRELHIEQALKCIDFMDRTVPRITGPSDQVSHNRKFPLLNHCPFFRVEELLLTTDWHDSTASTASFHLLTAVSAPFTVGRAGKFTEVPTGSSCLLPACFGSYTITPSGDGQKTIIRTTL
ncbi:MAG: class I mannose-6-phosphate isomerase [Lentisphaeria bacterium]|nr:class I mannose-6-phosphate isomerase [Lentisphaeria bacterium]